MVNKLQHNLQAEIDSESYFKSIFDNALYGIATTIDVDFRFVRVNDAFCRLLEYDRDELVGVRTVQDVTCPDDYGQNKQLLLSLVNNEIQQFRIEKQYLTKSGRVIDVAVYVIGFYDDNGKYIGSTGTVMDITNTKALIQRLRKSEEDLQQLAGKLLSFQEEERRRLARELHDDLAQRLAFLVFEARKVQSEVCSDEAVESLHSLQEKLIEITEDVHHISRQLHPSIIEDLGLEQAISSECQNFLRLVNIPVKFECCIGTEEPSLDIAISLFRLTQECLRNIQKHANAKNVSIQLVQENSSFILTIKDDGRGFRPEIVKNMPGLGLKSMRERIRLINGSISYTPRKPRGTVVEARVPI